MEPGFGDWALCAVIHKYKHSEVNSCNSPINTVTNYPALHKSGNPDAYRQSIGTNSSRSFFGMQLAKTMTKHIREPKRDP
jgi:hypothetical protein